MDSTSATVSRPWASKRSLPRRAHHGRTPTSSASSARSAASVSITSSSLMSVTCAVFCRLIFNITTGRELIFRSTRTVRRPAQHTRPPRARLSPSQRSTDCIIATNVAPPRIVRLKFAEDAPRAFAPHTEQFAVVENPAMIRARGRHRSALLPVVRLCIVDNVHTRVEIKGVHSTAEDRNQSVDDHGRRMISRSIPIMARQYSRTAASIRGAPTATRPLPGLPRSAENRRGFCTAAHARAASARSPDLL
jgi:hypothetical protein